MKKLSILLFALVLSLSAFAGKEPEKSSGITFQALYPEPHHRRVSQVVSQLLMRQHYRQRAIDDSLSSEMFDRYLESLDPQKLYFLQEDIDAFEQYRYRFDDFVRSGQVEEAFSIFNVYQKRAAERLTYVYRRLEQPFDFSREEYLEFDREDAPWARTRQELDDLWRKRLKHQALNLKLAGKEWPDVVETLRKRYKRIERNISQTQSEDVFQLLMNALSECFDPHTNYFSPKSFDDFKIRMSQSLEGIGARLMTENEYTKVVEIVPGGPADKSNDLHPNDRIIGVGQGVDGEIVDVIGWRIDDVVQLIRGKKSTIVRLVVLRAGEPEDAAPDTVVLVRDKIKLEDQSAKGDTLHIRHEGREYVFGVIDIPSFYADFDAIRAGDPDYKSTTRDVQKIIGDFRRQGRIDGLIIDLRGNGGGFLSEAIELTGLFIDRGPVVQVRETSGKVGVEWDNRPGVFYDGPLAVLVDRVSASASEIFAAAIQDYRRGIIIGSQTFGKGTVQRPIDLNRIPLLRRTGQRMGQVKITTAKFYRISGRSTQNVGVIPDLAFPSRYDYMDIGENTRPNALSYDAIDSVRHEVYGQLRRIIPVLIRRHQARLEKDPRYQEYLEELKEYQKARENGRISLNEAERRREREKSRQTEKSAAVNRPAAASDSAGSARSDSFHQRRLKDLLVQESGHVLADYLTLIGQN